MIKPALLDVNVLVALFDPEHIHHETAHRWFGSDRRSGWATCPLTENGLIRVVSNPAYPGRRTTFDDAVQRLRVFCEHTDHAFWPDSVSILDTTLFHTARAQGHRQTTDIYLLGVAFANDGVLATFDRAIPRATVKGAGEDNVLILA